MRPLPIFNYGRSLSYFLVILIILIFAEKSWALVGVGGYVPSAGKIQTDKEGKDNKFSFNPMLMIHHRFMFSAKNHFKPSLGYVFHSGTGDDYQKTTVFILYHLSWFASSFISINYGIGTFMTNIEGKQGEVTLQNGSDFSTFYRPGDSQSSYNTTLDLGIEFSKSKNYSLAIDGFLFSFLSKSKRSLSYSVSLNYYL